MRGGVDVVIKLCGYAIYLPIVFIGIPKARKAAVGKWAYINLDRYAALPSRHEVCIKPMRIIGNNVNPDGANRVLHGRNNQIKIEIRAVATNKCLRRPFEKMAHCRNGSGADC
ncbi:MAG: hypothetical protein NC131_14875 [Roseburia sp.]|nr:hypothetical protein [Roseburia sp.]